MLTKESFIKGIKDMRAVFGLNPEKETLEIWYRHLSKLDDKYFLAGISLMTSGDENERLKTIYPNQNMIDIFLSYAQKAREKELKAIEQIREPWQEERYKAICDQTRIAKLEADKRLIDRRPDLEEIFKRVFGGKKGVKLLE
jgi:hypothetical protein